MSNIIQFPGVNKSKIQFGEDIARRLDALDPKLRAVIESQITEIFRKHPELEEPVDIPFPDGASEETLNAVRSALESKNSIISSLINDLITGNIKYEYDLR